MLSISCGGQPWNVLSVSELLMRVANGRSRNCRYSSGISRRNPSTRCEASPSPRMNACTGSLRMPSRS